MTMHERPTTLPSSTTAPAEGGLVFASLPVLDLEPVHVGEARRALRAQGRLLEESNVERLLWLARALPPALNLLEDSRSAVPIRDVCFRGASVDAAAVAPSSDHSTLVAVAHFEEDDGGVTTGQGSGDDAVPNAGSAVVVQFFEHRALLASAGESALSPARCTVRILISPRSESTDRSTGTTSPPISLLRFTLGRPG